MLRSAVLVLLPLAVAAVGDVVLDGSSLALDRVVGDTWFSPSGVGYKNIPMWLSDVQNGHVALLPETVPPTQRQLTLECPAGGMGLPDTGCSFTVVLYACSPCVSDNGGLSSILASLGFTSGSCGPLVAASPGGKTGKTAFYRKVMGVGNKVDVVFPGDVFTGYVGVFTTIANPCSTAPPGFCSFLPGCKEVGGNCIEDSLCPKQVGPIQGGVAGVGSAGGGGGGGARSCLPCINA